jgi:hypothetical protein
MALTVNRELDHYVDQELRGLGVAADVHVFKGALLGLTAGGYVRPLTAGDLFAGIAYEEMDNTDGDDGAMIVRVYTQGDFGVTLTGATAASLGRPVFASADDTLTFVGAGNSPVGVVQDVVEADEIVLRIGSLQRPVKTIVHAVENLGAGADIAARAIHVFGGDAWIVAARVVNQASAPAGINDSNTCVVALAIDAGAVASATFNSGTAFPAANTAHGMGALTNAHAAAGDVLTLAVTNGAAADPGPFVVEVDYV